MTRAYLAEAKYEVIKSLRIPMFAIPTVAFPLMFYVLFGIILNGGQHVGPVMVSTYMMASYGAFGVVGVALFSFGVGVAMERGQGWLQVKRASPMPPGAYFFGKVVVSLVFSAAVVIALVATGLLVGGVRLPVTSLLILGVALVLGALPFSAMGLAIGYLTGPNSAPAVVNLIYLPMSFASGLWFPMRMLPDFFQTIAPAMPAFHLGRVAHAAIGAGEGSTVISVAALVGFSALFLIVAFWGMRRDEGKTYG
jgi:ABC-2 type transport system permease protein